MAQCPSGCRPELGGPWLPAFAGKTRGRKARGPGAAVWLLSRNGPQRSGPSAGTMLGFPPRSFPPRKRGPRSRGVSAPAQADLSAAGVPQARCLGALEKKAPPVPRRLWWFNVFLVATRCSVVPGSWAPAILPERGREGKESGGLGTAVWPLSWNGPQRSGPSAGTMLGFPPRSFPPRKRGPRSRGGAVATERSSAQRAFRRHGAQALLKNTTLRAAETVVV